MLIVGRKQPPLDSTGWKMTDIKKALTLSYQSFKM